MESHVGLSQTFRGWYPLLPCLLEDAKSETPDACLDTPPLSTSAPDITLGPLITFWKTHYMDIVPSKVASEFVFKNDDFHKIRIASQGPPGFHGTQSDAGRGPAPSPMLGEACFILGVETALPYTRRDSDAFGLWPHRCAQGLPMAVLAQAHLSYPILNAHSSLGTCRSHTLSHATCCPSPFRESAHLYLWVPVRKGCTGTSNTFFFFIVMTFGGREAVLPLLPS